MSEVRRKSNVVEPTSDENSSQVKQLIGILQNDTRLRQMFMQALGAREAVAQPSRTRKRRALSDDQVRKTVALIGDATHDPDFLPVPPDYMVQRAKELNLENPGMGDRLLDLYYQRWEGGLSMGMDDSTYTEINDFLQTQAVA